MLTASQRLFFDLNGYVLIRNAFTRAECTELVAIAHAMQASGQGRDPADRQHILHCPIRHSRKVLEVAMAPRLREPAEAIVGGEARLEECEFLVFFPDREIAAEAVSREHKFRWHRGLTPDYGSFEHNGNYHCLLAKVIVYLTPQGQRTGTWLVPGSHRHGVRIADFERLAQPEQEFATHVDAQQGDVLLFGETLIHSSPLRPYDEERILLVIAYSPPFMRPWSAQSDPPPELDYDISPEERRFIYGEARYDFRGEHL